MNYNMVDTECYMDFLIDSLAEFSDEDLDRVNDVDFEFFHEIMQDSSSDVIVSTKSKQKSFFPNEKPTPKPALNYIENSSSTDGSNKEVSTASSDVSFSSESQHSSFSLIPKFLISDDEEIPKSTGDQHEVDDDIFKKKLDLSANRLRFLARWTEMSRRQVMQLEKNLLSDSDTCSIFSNLEHESIEADALDHNEPFDAKVVDKEDKNIQDQDKPRIPYSKTVHIAQDQEVGALHNKVIPDENIVDNEDRNVLGKSSLLSKTEQILQDQETSTPEPSSPKLDKSIVSNNNTKTVVKTFDKSEIVVDNEIKNQPRISISNIECVSQRTRAHCSGRNDYKFDLKKITTANAQFSDMDDITALNKLQSSMEKTQLSRFMFAQAIREEKLRRLAMNNQSRHSTYLDQSMINKISDLSDDKRKNLDHGLEISRKRIRHLSNRNSNYGAFMA